MVKEHIRKFLAILLRSSFIVATAGIRLFETVSLAALLAGLGTIAVVYLDRVLDLNAIAHAKVIVEFSSSSYEQQEALKYLHSVTPVRNLLFECQDGLLYVLINTNRLIDFGFQSTASLLNLEWMKEVNSQFHHSNLRVLCNNGKSTLCDTELLMLRVATDAAAMGRVWGICLIWSAFRDFHRKGVKLRALTLGMAIILIGLGIPSFYNWFIVPSFEHHW